MLLGQRDPGHDEHDAADAHAPGNDVTWSSSCSSGPKSLVFNLSSSLKVEYLKVEKKELTVVDLCATFCSRTR